MFAEVYCPVPAILNAQPLNHTNEVSSTDVYTCYEGYEFQPGETVRTMTCQTDGSWIPSDSCWKRKCPPYIQYRGNITGGTEGEAKYKERIEVTCYLGYQFPDGTEVKRTRCGANYHWDPYLPLCEPKKCPGGTPPPVLNATPNTTEGIIETVVKYTCNASYTFIDGSTERIAYCDLETQEWVGVPTECLGDALGPANNIVGAGKILSTVTASLALVVIVVFMWLIVCSDCNEDRKLLRVCQSEEKEEEVESEDESEAPEEEPIRLQMVA
ncbi:hypothetical protein EB796_005587 [Bugula neritina]|uniref:Sushi domain-containing protein n=1 Tax=Bugula neritina TaxID=10212 RepID=A0A7J7KE31_BUGNE|nr:hypothetical protein EB796_005587 [Bugula neritina]